MTDGLPVFALIKQVGHKSGRSRFFCTNECHAKSKRYELRLQSQNLSCRVEALGSKTRPLHFSCYEKTSATSHVMKNFCNHVKNKTLGMQCTWGRAGAPFLHAQPRFRTCVFAKMAMWFGLGRGISRALPKNFSKTHHHHHKKVGNNTNKRGGGIYLSTYICSFFVFSTISKVHRVKLCNAKSMHGMHCMAKSSASTNNTWIHKWH